MYVSLYAFHLGQIFSTVLWQDQILLIPYHLLLYLGIIGFQIFSCLLLMVTTHFQINKVDLLTRNFEPTALQEAIFINARFLCVIVNNALAESVVAR